MKGIVIATVGLISAFSCQAIERDKKLHLAASTAISGVSMVVTEGDWKTSLVTCGSVGLGKELLDEVIYGGFSGEDLAYDTAGCLLGIAVGDQALQLWKQDDTTGIQYSFDF